MTIYEKIQAVSQEVGAISKDMNVGGQYKAVSDLAVTLAINKAEAKHRIISIPLKQELVSSEIYRNADTVVFETNNATTGAKQVNNTNNIKTTYVETIKMTVRFIDLDDDTKFVDVESFGRGLDSGDKGFGKASTYARKYALLNAYKIPTGEDPDKDLSPIDKKNTIDLQSTPEKRTPAQIELDIILFDIQSANSLDDLTKIHANNAKWHLNKDFMNALTNKKILLNGK